MGSDHGPVVPIRAAAMALRELPNDTRLVLIGDQAAIEQGLQAEGVALDAVDIVPSTDDIAMHDNPVKAMQAKPRSSISLGFHLLKEGKLDAFASTGNTGAMMVGSVFSIKPIEGVARPCIPTLVPKQGGGFGVLLDVGANADCKPDHLLQFGVLGYLLAKHVYQIAEPTVGLLNIGEEAKKGDQLRQHTHELMSKSEAFTFVGNVEGRDLFTPKADVIVTDGFNGNVVLKVVEGFHGELLRNGIEHPFLERFDYESYGGCPVLGVNGNVMIGHGISNATTIKNLIKQSREVVLSKLNERIRDAFR